MGYSKEDLKSKLLDMYPEIKKNDLSTDLAFDDAKKAWVVTFSKGEHSRHAFLDKKDADACVDGNVCIYLGVLIEQYIKDIEEELSGKDMFREKI